MRNEVIVEFTWYLTALIKEIHESFGEIQISDSELEYLFNKLYHAAHVGHGILLKHPNLPSLNRLSRVALHLHEHAVKNGALDQEAKAKGYLLGVVLGCMDIVRVSRAPLPQEFEAKLQLAFRTLKSGYFPFSLKHIQKILDDVASQLPHLKWLRPNPEVTKASAQLSHWSHDLAA